MGGVAAPRAPLHGKPLPHGELATRSAGLGTSTLRERSPQGGLSVLSFGIAKARTSVGAPGFEPGTSCPQANRGGWRAVRQGGEKWLRSNLRRAWRRYPPLCSTKTFPSVWAPSRPREGSFFACPSPRQSHWISPALSAGDSPRRGEVWSIYYADIGEAVTYCPECAEREFGETEPRRS
jgi:hypothetical protein